MSALKRYIPLPVRIRLRQESFFGCAECGNPILDYHHIIPWAKKHHNDPAHMVALCPTHHREIGKRQRAYAYELKKQPYNKMHGKFRGTLYTEKEKPSFIMGTNTFIKTPIILSFYDQALIKYRIDQGQSLISVFLPDADYWPEIEIIDNDIVANGNAFWDIQFSTNYLRLRKRKGESFLEIDLRGEDAKVAGNFIVGGENFMFSPQATNFAGVKISNSRVENCGTGFAYGSSKLRLIRPNYAMLKPEHFFSLK